MAGGTRDSAYDASKNGLRGRMKLGRFSVDTHVHAQRFAAGQALEGAKVDTSRARYGDLATVIRHLTPYDRADEMIWLRGMNVFPSSIETVVRGFPELDDEYEIVVDERSGLPALRVRVELRAETEAAPDLDARVRDALTQAIRVSSELEVLPFGTLPRADARAKKRRVRRGSR
jgi:phenylacetate-coenzyme A ligase PaaK-like adenylate-forming protein